LTVVVPLMGVMSGPFSCTGRDWHLVGLRSFGKVELFASENPH
jgi:hypothetical protein